MPLAIKRPHLFHGRLAPVVHPDTWTSTVRTWPTDWFARDRLRDSPQRKESNRLEALHEEVQVMQASVRLQVGRLHDRRGRAMGLPLAGKEPKSIQQYAKEEQAKVEKRTRLA